LPRLPLNAAFVAAACAFVLVFATAGTPIPLYNMYQAEDAITKGGLGIVSVGYFVAAATALLVLGRLSNLLGRKPVAIAALGCAAASCLVLSSMGGLMPLLLARLLQGLGCGLASGALGSYIVDSGAGRPQWLPALITGSAPMVGIPLGAVASGALAQYGPNPRALIFEIVAGLLALCCVLMMLSPETRRPEPGAMRSLRPQLQVPRGASMLLLAAGASFVGTWALGGFYQAFGPAIAAGYLGNATPLVAAAVFSSVMVLNPVGGSIGGRRSAAVGLRAGMAVFIVALAAIIASLRAGAIMPFIAASAVVGLAQGAASTAAIRGLLANAGAEERAGLLSTIYLISYSGAAIPAILAGRFASTFDLFEIAVGYAVLCVVASIIAIAAARNPRGANSSHQPHGPWA
jgi:MFS family permease